MAATQAQSTYPASQHRPVAIIALMRLRAVFINLHWRRSPISAPLLIVSGQARRLCPFGKQALQCDLAVTFPESRHWRRA